MKTKLELAEEKYQKTKNKIDRIHMQLFRLSEKKRKKISIKTRLKISMKFEEVIYKLKIAKAESVRAHLALYAEIDKAN